MGRLLAYAGGIFRILWVCRVSIADALVGVAFFGLIVQAQNLMADLSSAGSPANLLFWAGVFFFTFLLWAFPVHYGARRSLDQLADMEPGLQAAHPHLVELLPRLLGLMPFLALALAISGAREAVSHAMVLPIAQVTMTQGVWLYLADAITAIAFAAFVSTRRLFIPASWDGHLLYPIAAIVTALVFILAYLYPVWTSVHFPRALLVPPLFGSLVLIASWLTRVSDRTGFPVLLTAMLVLGVLTGLNVDFNLLRSLPNSGGDQRLKIDKAVEHWKAANACDTNCPAPIVVAIDGGASRAAFAAATFVGEMLDRMPSVSENKDPRQGQESSSPGRRIFAISGVSGGAYGAAVIQAALADAQQQGRDARTPPCQSAQTTWFAYQDWLDKGKRFTWRQCLQALTSGDYLSTTIIGLAFRDFIAPPWQKIGLPAMADRAALLEMTWERQYAATMEDTQSFYEGGRTCDDAGATQTGLCRRIGHPVAFLTETPPTQAPKPARPRWMPLLLLNGTSVATGRRIIAADLASSHVEQGDMQRGGALFSQAFDLREVLSDQCKDKPAPIQETDIEAWRDLQRASQDDVSKRTMIEGVCGKPKSDVDGPDVRLSTAALTSARFPIISPAGVFGMEKTIYGDQVVDGGYFENSGLTTASEIVAALGQHGLKPALVSISNNPAYSPPSKSQLEACEGRFQARNGSRDFSPAVCTGLPRRLAMTPLEPPADTTFLGRFLSLFWRPFQTLVATGDGHAYEAMARILSDPPPNGFFHLTVDVAPSFADKEDDSMIVDPSCAEMAGKKMTVTAVSMSWWLAAAVQADLDIQRCSRLNRQQLKSLHDLMK